MTRRAFLPAAAASVAAGNAAAADAPKGAILELRRYQLRNSADNQRARTSDILKAQVAACQRAGVGPVGVFSNTIGPDGPFLLTLVSYPSLAGMEQAQAKLAADAEYQKALDAYHAQPGLGYERVESSLLRAFDGYPAVVPPPSDGKRAARLFELRMYESNSPGTLRKKVKMFNDGEIGAFQRAGGQPVFFGETIVGARQPNLTYMLSYEDLAGREKVWKAFGADPEWQRLRTTPGLSDAEIVSNISNCLVSPLAFSQIR
ncbi:MAG: family containing protein [Candidatus Solibacter sp.]|nr:family containing protein [Candidatus Solibacter sp.]